MTTRLSAIAIALAASPLFSAHAEPTPVAVVDAKDRIERIVVTAAGYETKLIDAPASVTVVTREDLATKPYSGLADALRDIEGIDVGSGQDKNGNLSITMRGLPAEYTLVLIDGRRQNDTGDIGPNNFGNSQYMYMPPLAAIERIEVVRGPMSTLYGSDAIGGVVNIITRRALKRWHGDISVAGTVQEDQQYGNDQKLDFYVTGPVAKRLSLALRGSGYWREPSNPGYITTLPLPDGTSWTDSGSFGDRKVVGGKSWNYGATLDYNMTKKQRFALSYDRAKQRYDNTQSQVGTLDSAENMWRADNDGLVQPRVGYAPYQRVQREQFVVSHLGLFDGGVWRNSVTHSISENLGRSLPLTLAERANFQALWDQAVAEQGVNRPELTDAIRAQIEADFLPRPNRALKLTNWIVDSSYEMNFTRNKLVVGAQYLDVAMEDGVFGFYGEEYRAGTTQDHRQWALFAENNFDATDALTLTAGARYDHHNVFSGQWSPRVYLNYRLNPDWTFKGGISTGYKAPKPNDLFPGITGFGRQGTIPLVGSPNLQPETSVNYEAAVYFDNANDFTANLTVFYNQFDDKIIRQDSAPNCEIAQAGQYCVDIGDGWADLGFDYFTQYANVDKAVTQGAEVYAEYDFTQALNLRANYTYTHSEVRSGADQGLPLVNTPKHMANATLSYAVNDALSLDLRAEIRGERFRGTANVSGPQGPETVEEYYKSYELFHVGASYDISDAWTLRARINNLLDTDLSSRSCLLADNESEYLCSPDYNTAERARSFWLSASYSF